MATDEVPREPVNFLDAALADEPNPILRALLRFAKSLASLHLTSVLFALAIFVILVGTLAQDKQGMWEVISAYFRAWISWIKVPVFFPSSWFPNMGERMMRFLVASGTFGVGAAIAIPCIARMRRHVMWLIGGLVVAALAISTAVQSVTMGGFLFPGGAVIGSALVVNLLAAHIVRFRIQATGIRLAIGLAVIAVGAAITWLVIAAGHNKEGLQAVPIFEWSTLWLLCKIALAFFWLAILAGFAVLLPKARTRTIEVVTLGTSALLLGGLLFWLWVGGDDAYLGDAGMRILWQLIQSTGAAAVLLAGCILVFKRRGGSVLIHGGVALLMLGEWFVSWYAVEEDMTIREGETCNFATDSRDIELAIVDPSYSDTEDDVVAIPRSLLLRHEKTGEAIEYENLPFDVRVDDYVANSRVRRLRDEEEGPVTIGFGTGFAITDIDDSDETDSRAVKGVASAYITLAGKDDGEEIGTFLVSQFQARPDHVTVGDKTYYVSLRVKHTYKPYSIHLFDFRKDDYLGTSKAMNFSSDIRLVDPTRGVDREIHIRMNNPLRYAGETFYQHSFDDAQGRELTVLQVVTNTGWMMPYVSCMVVFVGMAAHFFNVLMRFLRRRAESVARDAKAAVASFAEVPKNEGSKNRRRRKRDNVAKPPGSTGGGFAKLAPTLVPLLVVLLTAGWVASKTRAPSLTSEHFDLEEFGKLPVVFEGRVKPFDTLARNSLRKTSDYDSFRDEDGERQPAVRWLLDVIARPEEADEHKVFRIYNLEILDTLGLEPRRGYHYSLAEIRGTGDEEGRGLKKLYDHLGKAAHLDEEERTFYQKKAIELNKRFQGYSLVSDAFQRWQPPETRAKEVLESDGGAAITDWYRRVLWRAAEEEMELDRTHPPLLVPDLLASEGNEKTWHAYPTAHSREIIKTFSTKAPELASSCLEELLDRVQRMEEMTERSGREPDAAMSSLKTALDEMKEILGKKPSPAFLALEAIFDAYGNGDAGVFNREVAKYRKMLARANVVKLDTRTVAFESFYNRSAPFYYCMVLYGFAFALAFSGCLGWQKVLGRTAFWLLLFILCIHTFGIVSRIYISGRPPITNLYSSAVSIAWMCAVTGLILEAVFRLGFGNVVAGISGFSILLIAQFLGLREDTFTVLVAVLDTQFWLTLHVIAIAIGYAATFVAGVLGIIYIVKGYFTPTLDDDTGKALTRMTYGILCFAIVFSFWGTILGGLWADDSWGRFWGWDPKENGALIIVLWNAIILHARWTRAVRDRGMAVLAVAGNIVTGWSWFGVNELGVGKHAYGFTEGVLLWLSLFVASQLVIIAIGSLPKEMWKSFKDQDEPAPAEAMKPG